MNVKSRHRESTPPVVAAERHGFTRVAVIRRIDSKPPTRVWSLLLPPSFLNIEPEVVSHGYRRGRDPGHRPE
ncbi:MAG: hypothetical protein ABSH51_05995 [Solirubrobacteraceae bacterium]|jgi:hypothetical protein